MQDTLMELPKTHYAELDILFGDEAIAAWHDGARTRNYLQKLGKIKTHIFQTKEALTAYLAGLEDANKGANDYVVIRTKLNT